MTSGPRRRLVCDWGSCFCAGLLCTLPVPAACTGTNEGFYVAESWKRPRRRPSHSSPARPTLPPKVRCGPKPWNLGKVPGRGSFLPEAFLACPPGGCGNRNTLHVHGPEYGGKSGNWGWGCCSWTQGLEDDGPGLRLWWTQKFKNLNGRLGPEYGAEFREGP